MSDRAITRIRTFQKQDMHKVLEIEEQAFPKTAYSEEMFLGYAEDFPDGFVVIEASEDIVGYMIFDMSGHIHSTAVKHAYRRKGFGRMLFLHALKYANTQLWLEVRSKNHDAVQFYKKLGMRTVGIIPNYYETDDALVMVSGQNEAGQRCTVD